jgi:lipoate-protein ligase A
MAALRDDLAQLHFERPWQMVTDCGPWPDLTTQVLADEVLLRQVIDGERGPCLMVWRGRRCLMATRREARLPGFAQACAELERDGWPVRVRCSGGACVPQDEGVLNLSIVHPRLKGWTLEDGYRLLDTLLLRLLAGFGVRAETGAVPGSFCDGRHNLHVAGRKLVGTAQRWAGGSRKDAAVLAHACLMVALDTTQATAKINRLYQVCGHRPLLDPASATTLCELLGHTGPTVELVDAAERHLLDSLRDSFVALC